MSSRGPTAETERERALRPPPIDVDAPVLSESEAHTHTQSHTPSHTHSHTHTQQRRPMPAAQQQRCANNSNNNNNSNSSDSSSRSISHSLSNSHSEGERERQRALRPKQTPRKQTPRTERETPAQPTATDTHATEREAAQAQTQNSQTYIGSERETETVCLSLFTDRSLCAAYETHCHAHSERSLLLPALSLCAAAVLVPLQAQTLLRDTHTEGENERARTVTSALALCGAVVCAVSGLLLLLLRCHSLHWVSLPCHTEMDTQTRTPTDAQRIAKQTLSVLMLCGGFLFFCVSFIREGFSIETDTQTETQSERALTNAVLLFFFPAVVLHALPSLPLSLVLLAETASLVLVLVSMEKERRTLAVILGVCACAVALAVDGKRESVRVFAAQKARAEGERNSEEKESAHAKAMQEMRHMMANVAHDLKTPLSSFSTSLDIVFQRIADFHSFLSVALSPSALSLTQTALSFSENVATDLSAARNTNAFMVMTINRIIEFAKSQDGVKLVPREESFNLAEALELPLCCMRNVQERIPIGLDSVAEELCTHIITDKQWLQENLLCLLSNAVKYSSEGQVTVSLRLETHTLTHSQRESAARNRPLSAVSLSLSQSYAASPEFFVQQRHEPQHSLPVSLSLSLLEEGAHNDAHSVTQSSHGTQAARTASGSHRESERARERGSGRVTQFLVLEVCDCGIGVPAHKRDALFAPFTQTQRLAGGTGLGLFSLARRVDALKGRYGVRPRDDGERGSVFWFALPYKPDEISAQSEREIEGELEMQRETERDTASEEVSFSPSLSRTHTPFFQSFSLSPSSSSSSLKLPTYTQTQTQTPAGARPALARHRQRSSEFRGVSLSQGTRSYSTLLAKYRLPCSHNTVETPLREKRDPVVEKDREKSSGKEKGKQQGSEGAVTASCSLSFSSSPLSSDVIDTAGVPVTVLNPVSESDIAHQPNTSADSMPFSPAALTPSSSQRSITPLQRQASRAVSQSAAQQRALRVLLVDDSPMIVKVTSKLLSSLGHDVRVAHNGDEALQLVTSLAKERAAEQRREGEKEGENEDWFTAFDLVLMDLQMPVMDGLEATRRIRLLEKEQGLQGFYQLIVGMSANEDEDTHNDALDAGMDHFVGKPFNSATFQTIIDTLFEIDEE